MIDAYFSKLEVEDARFALVAHVIASVNRGKGKAPKIEDFMPRRRGGPRMKPKQSTEAQIEMAVQITKAFGGKIPERFRHIADKPMKGA